MAYLYATDITTDLGPMFALSNDNGICLLEFYERKNFFKQIQKTEKIMKSSVVMEKNPYLLQLERELIGYFSGTLRLFTVPLCMTGTDFQKSVWRALSKIPYGKTLSYADLAVNIGNPKAVRAVANANAQNKISVIIPCHRVIGKGGNLVGYASGLERKKYLLTLESKLFVVGKTKNESQRPL